MERESDLGVVQSTMSSLDSIFEQAVASSSATSSQDAVLVALHASLLSAGFVCVSIGDEVSSLNHWYVTVHHTLTLRDLQKVLLSLKTLYPLPVSLSSPLAGTVHRMHVRYSISTNKHNSFV